MGLGLHGGQERAVLSQGMERKWGLVKTRNFLTTPGCVPEFLVSHSGMEILSCKPSPTLETGVPPAACPPPAGP